MRRALTALVMVALALPVLALAAMIGQQEWLRTRVTVLNVALRGFDPRDLLRGHYLTARFDWNWEGLPQPDAEGRLPEGALCVSAIDAVRKPRVSFLPASQPVDGGCLLLIPGAMWGSDVFVPATIETTSGGFRLFVPETRAAELDRLIRERPGALTVDLAVRGDGGVSILTLRIDGRVLGR